MASAGPHVVRPSSTHAAGQPPLSLPELAIGALSPLRLEPQELSALRLQWSCNDVRNEISSLELAVKRKRNSILARMEPLLACIEQYSEVASIFAQVNQSILAPVWGSIRLLVVVLRSYEAYVEGVVAQLEEIHRNLPRYSEYVSRYPERKRLFDAVTDTFLVSRAVHVPRMPGTVFHLGLLH